MEDPFASADDNASAARERHVAVRRSGPPASSFGFIGSRVRDGVHPRNMSVGTIWTVGGTIVTEGVASTPNGRGGRVTSGSCAAHHTADFLRRRSSSENNAILSQRLAVAMDLDIGGRVLEHSSPSSTGSSSSTPSFNGKTVWRNGRWENDKTSPCKSKLRLRKKIPTTPFRVLDAPSLRDDYYCSLLAYSPTLHSLAVGLGAHVYLWSESPPEDVTKSLVVPFTAHITTISFSSPEGGHAILAIGRADGRITLWSPLDTDPRFDCVQPAPVSCLTFRPTSVRRRSGNGSGMMVGTEELLVGDELGNVYFYFVEWSKPDERDLFDWDGCMTLLARISCHSQQICGIAWRSDGEAFATGGNDNQLFLFETKKILNRRHEHSTSTRSRSVGNPDDIQVRNNTRRQLSSSSSTTSAQTENKGLAPLAIKLGHQKQLWTLNAAVKAIAFAPWQPTILAAGGGSNDRCIRFFHTLTGASLATIDCHAQVTSLVFSPRRKELIATFGFAQPEHLVRVGVFAWPSCRTVGAVPWHGGERALWAVVYNGGQPITGREDTEQDGLRGSKRGDRRSDVAALVVAGSDGSIKFHEVF
ncbi:WD40 repeat-like protein [Polychaeton citri CBS 116435]|uniref:WD40 repeat-like protein n=1 Tax=Polychaeton citri CBS 116435 TaxID=1314669 RepID=A0A9P4USY0_9PEZI|nr:WD40 repeat-like protein [Polychaeton citri CBS 116435]